MKEIEYTPIEEIVFNEYRKTRNYNRLIEIVERFNKFHNMFISIGHEFYKTGVNVTVQVVCYNKDSNEFYENKLCSGLYGDNGEFSTDLEALEFGVKKAIELLKINHNEQE